MVYYYWFAWYPVKTVDRGWQWLTKVKVFDDFIEGLEIRYYQKH